MEDSQGDECPFILQGLDKRHHSVLLLVIRRGTYVQKDMDSGMAKPRSGIEDFARRGLIRMHKRSSMISVTRSMRNRYRWGVITPVLPCARQRFLVRDYSRLTRENFLTKEIGVIAFITYSLLAFVAVVRLPYLQLHFLIDPAFNSLLLSVVVHFDSTVLLQGEKWVCLGVQFASCTCDQLAAWLSFHSAKILLAISLTALSTLRFRLPSLHISFQLFLLP